MITKEKQAYFDATFDSATRGELVQALELAKTTFPHESIVAIDCGCGAGSDIHYLRQQQVEVYGFDIEEDAIARCRRRFGDDQAVHLARSSFADYEYPTCHLAVADASLFFCSPSDFSHVWHKLQTAMLSGGVFVGSFLGERDTMASQDYDKDAFWPEVSTFTAATLMENFSAFTVESWVEHELDGKTQDGVDHHWHIYSVILQKRE